MVVRLAGTNVDKANALLKAFSEKNKDIKLIVNPSFDGAARSVIEQSKK